MATFKEITVIEPTYHLEFMIDVDIKTFKVIDCYTYAKDLKDSDELYEVEEITKMRWKVGKNSLFVHNKRAAKTVLNHCIYIPETLQDWEFAHKLNEAMKLHSFEICEPDELD